MVINRQIGERLGVAVWVPAGAAAHCGRNAVFLDLVDIKAAREKASRTGILNNGDAGGFAHGFTHVRNPLILDSGHRDVGNRLRCFPRRQRQPGSRTHGR